MATTFEGLGVVGRQGHLYIYHDDGRTFPFPMDRDTPEERESKGDRPTTLFLGVYRPRHEETQLLLSIN